MMWTPRQKRIVRPTAVECSGLGLGLGFGGGGVAAPAAPVLTAMSHTVIDTAGGGQRTVFTVNNSTGCVSAQIAGGAAFTSFAIDDATHVSGIAPAHAAGAVNFTVTNGVGVSNSLSGSKYWNPSLVTSVAGWLDANRGTTDAGAGALSAWLDGTSNAYNFVQGTGANRPTITAAQFGSLPGIVFVKEQNVRLASAVILAGMSVFAVAKWTSTDAVASRPDTIPLTIFGDMANASMAFGASAGKIASLKLNSGATPVTSLSTATTFNDGAAHHIGAVTASATTKLYAGGALVDTDSTGGGIYASTTFDAVGNTYTASDGFAGTLGELVWVTGTISAGDLSDLYEHARQRWGVT